MELRDVRRNPQVFFLFFVLFLIFFPLSSVFYQSLFTGPFFFEGVQFNPIANYVGVFTSPLLQSTMLNTLILSVFGTALAVLIGTTFALLIHRTDLPFKSLFQVLSFMPLVVSGLTSALGFVFTVGDVGYLTLWWEGTLGFPRLWDIYGIAGITIISAISHAPITYLYVSSSLLMMDSSLEESAIVMGAGRFRTLLTVTLPMAKSAILFGAILTIIGSFEQFSIPFALGGKRGILVFATWVYTQLPSMQWGSVAAASTLIMIVMICLIVAQKRYLGPLHRYVTVRGGTRHGRVIELGLWKFPIAIMLLLFVLGAIVVPIAGVVYRSFVALWLPSANQWDLMTLSNYVDIFSLELYKLAILNSMLVSIGGATIGIVFFAFVAYFAYKGASKTLGAVMETVSTFPIAVPSVIMGIGVLWAWGRVPFMHNSFWIFIIAYVSRYIPSGMRAIGPNVIQLSRDMEEASIISGASWLRTFRSITFPLMRPGMAFGWLLLFVTILKELSMAIFLQGPETKLIATVIAYALEMGKMGGLGLMGALSTFEMVVSVSIFLLVTRIFRVKF